MSKINKLISGDQVLSEFYEHLIELEVVDSTNNFAKNLYEKKMEYAYILQIKNLAMDEIIVNGYHIKIKV